MEVAYQTKSSADILWILDIFDLLIYNMTSFVRIKNAKAIKNLFLKIKDHILIDLGGSFKS